MVGRSAPLRSEAVSRPLRPLLVLCAAGAFLAAFSLTSCMPQKRGPVSEVDDRTEGPARPPAFPASGPVSRDLLIDGIVYDLTSSEADLDLWVPPVEQAQCAATQIVDTLTPPRLSELGYRPATTGASLNDIDLTDAERSTVAMLFAGCVDMREAVASLLMGNSHMEAREATCMANGLRDQDLLAPFATAWAFGRTVSPASDDGVLATAMLSLAKVCLPGDAFDWYDRKLPGDDEVIGSGQGSGTTSTTVTGQEDGLTSRIGSTSVP